MFKKTSVNYGDTTGCMLPFAVIIALPLITGFVVWSSYV